jgi:hypothetical protein
LKAGLRVAAFWLLAAAASVQAQQMQIQFAEKVDLAATAGDVQFDAYGRRFTLTLAVNDRLFNKLSTPRSPAFPRRRCCAARSRASRVPGCAWPR